MGTIIDAVINELKLRRCEERSIPLPQEHFSKIIPSNVAKKILFVDGGHGTIIEEPHYCVTLVRLHAVTYDCSKRVAQKTKEFYAYVRMKKGGDGMFVFVVSFFGDMDGSYSFIVEEKMLPSDVIEVVRKVCELRFTKEQLKNLDANDIVVLDGNLEATHSHEERALYGLFVTAREKGIILAGLSKTTRFISKEGVSIITLLHNQSPQSTWYYELQDRIHFTKLHPKSSYIFRLDTAKPKEVCEALLSQAADPSFLGYPYGLVEADARARVSRKEVKRLKTIVSLKMGEEISNKALDAHSVLDAL